MCIARALNARTQGGAAHLRCSMRDFRKIKKIYAERGRTGENATFLRIDSQTALSPEPVGAQKSAAKFRDHLLREEPHGRFGELHRQCVEVHLQGGGVDSADRFLIALDLLT